MFASAGTELGIGVLVAAGGGSASRQLAFFDGSQLTQPAVVVATPGRLLDLVHGGIDSALFHFFTLLFVSSFSSLSQIH